MVGMATRASNNHISSIWGNIKGNLNTLGLQYREKCQCGFELTVPIHKQFRSFSPVYLIGSATISNNAHSFYYILFCLLKKTNGQVIKKHLKHL